MAVKLTVWIDTEGTDEEHYAALSAIGDNLGSDPDLRWSVEEDDDGGHLCDHADWNDLDHDDKGDIVCAHCGTPAPTA